jgi:hypothetical protein
MFLMEGSYKFEHNNSGVDPGTPEVLSAAKLRT